MINTMKEHAQNIVLTGFRATGKTSVGLVLAEKLGYAFIDTDVLLSERLGDTVADIVSRHGWEYFRRAERALLTEVAAMEQTVVATGGGAIEHGEQWQKIRQGSYVVWLDADTATIVLRMQGDPRSADQRPSLSGAPPSEEVAALLEKRRPLYRAGADLHLDTSFKAPVLLAAEIIRQKALDGLQMDEAADTQNSIRQDVPEGTGKEQ